VILNRVPKKDSLINRRIRIDNKCCSLCEVEEECISHLFFTCNVSRVVWNQCNKWIGINNVQLFKLKQHFQQFYLTELNNKQNGVWKCMWMAIVWVIIFRDETVDAKEVFTMAQLKTWGWIINKYSKLSFTYSY